MNSHSARPSPASSTTRPPPAAAPTPCATTAPASPNCRPTGRQRNAGRSPTSPATNSSTSSSGSARTTSPTRRRRTPAGLQARAQDHPQHPCRPLRPLALGRRRRSSRRSTSSAPSSRRTRQPDVVDPFTQEDLRSMLAVCDQKKTWKAIGAQSSWAPSPTATAASSCCSSTPACAPRNCATSASPTSTWRRNRITIQHGKGDKAIATSSSASARRKPSGVYLTPRLPERSR